MRKDFCAFILSHGRPNRVHTYKTLRRSGYTGKIYIVIDDEDGTAEEYRKRYGDEVLQFCKKDYAEKLDEGDNSGKRISTIYARAAMFDLAKQVGCNYFIQLDDDYTNFALRFNSSNKGIYTAIRKSLNEVFLIMIDFFANINALSLAMGQGGDLIGGTSGKSPKLLRKCMNSFICSLDKKWFMKGRMNEDVNTYVDGARRGELFFTTNQVQLVQTNTQQSSGGMSDLYIDSGTYVKTFYSVIFSPSCVKVATLGDPCRWGAARNRIHHKINWNRCAPKILREEWKKAP